ncbi:DUF2142 domain-containing protein [Luteimonas sp. A537]
MNPTLDASARRWPAWWVLLPALFILMQAWVMLHAAPPGIPPDELAHLSYVRDAAGSGLPDYAAGRIHDSAQANYLTHPPLYYTVLGAAAAAGGLDPFSAYVPLRAISALFATVAFALWLLLGRELGLRPGVQWLLALATAAVPMYGFLAGSVNNDTLAAVGPPLFLLGAAREFVSGRPGRSARIAMAAGLVVTVLTKATVAAFLVMFVAASLAPLWRQLPALLRRNAASLAWLGSASLLCAAWYAYARIAHGSFLPAPGTLYAAAVPGDDPMVPARFAQRYAQIMFDRLGLVMSHAPFKPFTPTGDHVLQLMFVLPVLAWLFARPRAARRGVAPAVARATDAFGLAILGMALVHWYVTYVGYRASGLLAGLQPRYFLFLLPGLWMPPFLLETRRRPRHLFAIAFTACAIVAFWSSAPRLLADQTQAVAEARAAASVAAQATPPAARLQGHVDEVDVADGRARLRGWAFDTRCMCAVEAVVVQAGGRELGRVGTGMPRPDVATALGSVDAGTAGFEMVVEEVPAGNGACDLALTVEAADGSRLALVPMGCN